MHQYASHHIEVSTDSTETDTSVTESETESSPSITDLEGAYADITKLLMAQPEETEQAQPSQPESYFEIPSDIDEPAESSTHQPPQPQAQIHTNHQMVHGLRLMTFSQSNGERS